MHRNLLAGCLRRSLLAQTLLLHVPSRERAPRNGRPRSLPNTFATRSAVRLPRARCERQQGTGHGRHGSCDARPSYGCTKFDPTERLDMVTMGLPELTGRWEALRVPLFVVHHSWVLKHRTMDDVFGLLRWSMDQAAVGVMHQKRHNGSAWAATDVWRPPTCGANAVLDGSCSAEVSCTTKDWKMFKDICQVSQHNVTHGFCPWCEVTPAGLRHVSSMAPWRRQRAASGPARMSFLRVSRRPLHHDTPRPVAHR